MTKEHLKYIVIRKSRIKNIFFSLFFIFAFSQTILFKYREKTFEVLNNLNLFNFIKLDNSVEKSLVFSFLFISFSSLIPYLVVSFFEFFQVEGKFTRRLKRLSLFQITDKNTPDYKFADLFYFILNLLRNQIPFITVIFSLGLSVFNKTISNSFDLFFQSTFGEFIYNLNGILPGILAILIFDLKDYFFHWMQHNVNFFWDFHEFHHSATRMNLLNGSRLNIFETIFLEPLSFPINAFLGLLMANYVERGQYLPLVIYFIYLVAVNFVGTLAHGNTKIIFPKYLSFFFMSPSLHWIHHSKNPEHYNKNLGVLLSIWDRLFGTYASEEELFNIKGYGVHNSEYNCKNPIKAYFFVPLQKTSKRLKKIFI